MERVEELEIEVAPEEAGAREGRSSRRKRLKFPSYNEMVTDALVTLREKDGSSPCAIQKFLEEKHGGLPPNFRKQLPVQLRRMVTTGRLVSVKNSYKLSPAFRRQRTDGEAYEKGRRALVKSLIPVFSRMSSDLAQGATASRRSAQTKGKMHVLDAATAFLSKGKTHKLSAAARRRRTDREAFEEGRRAMVEHLIDMVSRIRERVANTGRLTAGKKGIMGTLDGLKHFLEQK